MQTSKLLALSFLLFSFTTFSLPGAGADDPNPTVVDIFGHNVTAHSAYYIYGTPYGTHHTNLQVSVANESSCPHRIILSAISSTERVSISPVVEIPDDPYIRVGTEVKFRFDFSPDVAAHMCDSPEWRVFNETEEWFVTTGCHNDIYNWFKIVRFNDPSNCPATYQLLYCPKPEPFCDCKCVPIGYREDVGSLNLIATQDKPFPIAFGKA